jgi:hypothetical protein
METEPMNRSTVVPSAAQLLAVVGGISVVVVAVIVFSWSRPATPNDSIGRYQMQVTNSGTIVVLDTVAGVVTNVAKISDYQIGGRTFENR